MVHLNHVLQSIQDLGLADQVEISSELREGQRWVVTANVEFVDGSTFYLKEFISGKYGINRLSYSYHYQSIDGILNFRYDNAEHRPKLTFKEHKHLANSSIIEHQHPPVERLVEELLSYFDR
ncbi:MAG: DUF6516 family protein [Leptolyngbyaceae cyanobacterium]